MIFPMENPGEQSIIIHINNIDYKTYKIQDVFFYVKESHPSAKSQKRNFSFKD